jgi:hypothetical protein
MPRPTSRAPPRLLSTGSETGVAPVALPLLAHGVAHGLRAGIPGSLALRARHPPPLGHPHLGVSASDSGTRVRAWPVVGYSRAILWKGLVMRTVWVRKSTVTAAASTCMTRPIPYES